MLGLAQRTTATGQRAIVCALLGTAVSSVGCGGRTLGQQDEGESSSASNGSAEAGESEEAGTGPETETETETESNSGSTSGTGADLPMDTCAPPGVERVNFWLSGLGEFENADINARCTVASIYPGFEGGWYVDLEQCVGDSGVAPEYQLTIDSSANTMPLLSEGQSVGLRYVQEQSIVGGNQKWLAMTSEGDDATLLVGGMVGAVMPEQDPPSPLYVSYFPLAIENVSEGCTPVDVEGCGDVERRALEVTWGEDQVRVLDHGTGYIGPLASYEITVAEFSEYIDLLCDDTEERWFEALFVLLPEG